jgi:light-regulated signal transduction histidine kinase (bacteriophytochrome)
MRRRGGSPIWVALRAVKLADGRLMAFCQDITERKRAEAALRELNADLERRVAMRTAELEATNRELESFSYSVSHDLRAPLRAIQGFSRILLEDCLPTLDETGREYLNRVCTSVDRMGRLIEDLLGLSRISRTKAVKVTVDLSAIARDAAEELRLADPQRDADFVIAPGVRVVGDPGLLRIVLQNLLGNAWKFTGKKPRARIEFGIVTSAAGQTTCFVRDEGAGFDMAYADQLFGVFKRLHPESEFPGTGIGLATVRRIVASHGGRIWAEAEPDRGATFFFTLAAAPPED